MTAPGYRAAGRIEAGDLFGGLAAALVALPSAVAFGLIVFSPLGPETASAGAAAGLIGAVALGLVAPLAGGTARLVTAPCAPAAAVLGAFTLSAASLGAPRVLVLLTLICAACGALQLLFGLLRGGRLVKYIPYPVVGGYLSSVGALIILGQVPKLLGIAASPSAVSALLSPSAWSPPAVIVGLAAMALLVLTGRVTKKVPATIVALAGSMGAYFALGAVWPELRTLEGNPLVIGRVEAGVSGIGLHVAALWGSLGSLGLSSLAAVLAPAVTLAVLLSIDTLKTCIVVDALTRSRHDSDRELVGQGLANLASALCGGIAGAGTSGPTLINLSSGGKTRWSGMMEGVFAAAAFALLAPLVAWIPVPALAGILVVVGWRMMDFSVFRLLRQRSTALDFCVVAVVVVTALASNLIAAAGAGIGMAILLYIREEVRGSVVRRRLTGRDISSKRQRLPADREILQRRGGETMIWELQGALFFGTTDQLAAEVEPHLAGCRHVVFSMRRVHTVDFSAAHILKTLVARLHDLGGRLSLTHLSLRLPTGQKLREYLVETEVVGGERGALVFPDLSDALEWIEEEVLREEGRADAPDRALELAEIEIFSRLQPEVLRLLRECARPLSFAKGEAVFRQGDEGDTLFAIRRGEVRILLPLEAQARHHLATLGPGDFFGDLSFLDRKPRSADAVATRDTEVFALSRSEFDRRSGSDARLGWHVHSGLSRVLAARLRQTNAEVRTLAES